MGDHDHPPDAPPPPVWSLGQVSRSTWLLCIGGAALIIAAIVNGAAITASDDEPTENRSSLRTQYLEELDDAGWRDFYVSDGHAVDYIGNLCDSVREFGGGNVGAYKRRVLRAEPDGWNERHDIVASYCGTALDR